MILVRFGAATNTRQVWNLSPHYQTCFLVPCVFIPHSELASAGTYSRLRREHCAPLLFSFNSIRSVGFELSVWFSGECGVNRTPVTNRHRQPDKLALRDVVASCYLCDNGSLRLLTA
jgi:hypothetical protein